MADTTKTLREAADAALAVLVTASSFLSKKARDRAPKVIADLRAALAAQAQAEPVAWIRHDWCGSGERILTFDGPPHPKPIRDEVVNPVWTPLYTAPLPAAQPVAQAEPVAQANRIYAADMTCSSCRNKGSDACMSCDAISADLPPRMYQAKLANGAPQPAAQAQPTEASGRIKEPYTLSEIRQRIASHDYNAELLLQHAMLLLAAQAQGEPVDCRDLLMRAALALEVVSGEWRESDPTLRVDLARATAANSAALAAQAQAEPVQPAFIDTENPQCNDGGAACLDCMCIGRCLAEPKPAPASAPTVQPVEVPMVGSCQQCGHAHEIPSHLALVPVEPTPEMVKAGTGWGTARSTWAAMLAAAPKGGA